MTERKPFGSLDPMKVFGDRQVPVAILWGPRRPHDGDLPGFSGLHDRLGIVVALVGDSGSMKDFARRFVSFRHAFIRRFHDDASAGFIPADGRPFLKTVDCYNLVTDCPSCGEFPLKAGEIVDLARKGGIQEKGAIEALKKGPRCLCGQGRVVDWQQIDPFDCSSQLSEGGKNAIDEAIQVLRPTRLTEPDDVWEDRLKRDPAAVRWTESDEDFAKRCEASRELLSRPLRIPGAVGLSRSVFGDNGDLPEGDLYDDVIRQANARGLRADLLNNLELGSKALSDVRLVAPPASFGTMRAADLDKGFRTPNDIPYRVELCVHLQRAMSGKEPKWMSKKLIEVQNRAFVNNRGFGF